MDHYKADAVFFQHVAHLAFNQGMHRVLQYPTKNQWDVPTLAKSLSSKEAAAVYLDEFIKACETLDLAQYSIVSLVQECNRLKIENEFMLRLINRHGIGESKCAR